MSEEKPLVELIKSLEDSQKDILQIIKAMANEKRLKILIALLTGAKAFEELKEITSLEKTALANHLSQLVESSFIEKPALGLYKITEDGEKFIKILDITYENSNIWKKRKTEILQQRKFSDSFVESFFSRSL